MNWHDSKCFLSFSLNFCVKWWIKWQLDRNNGKHFRHNYQAANIPSEAQHDSFLLPRFIPFGYNPNLSRHSCMVEITESLMLSDFFPFLCLIQHLLSSCLSIQISRAWKTKYIGSFLFWSSKVIFLPVFLNCQICSLFCLPLHMLLLCVCCLRFYKGLIFFLNCFGSNHT